MESLNPESRMSGQRKCHVIPNRPHSTWTQENKRLRTSACVKHNSGQPMLNLPNDRSELTSCSGTPKFLSKALASFSGNLLKSASVPVTVFLIGVSFFSSSCKRNASTYQVDSTMDSERRLHHFL